MRYSAILHSCALGISCLALGLSVASGAAARDISVSIKPAGAAKPESVAFGQGADLPEMEFDSRKKAYHRLVPVESVDPEVYELSFDYGASTYQLPVRLHRNSRPINLRAKFDGQPYCREPLVKLAETRAQPGNIEQALERYLLAVHLLGITSDDAKCRDNQPSRLRKARLERGIQLALFRGSPFLPPESDPSEWDAILGETNAVSYRRQVRRAEAITLGEDRKAAIAAREYASAAEINTVLIARSEASAEEKAALVDVGLTDSRLQQDQAFLENRAIANGQAIESRMQMEMAPGQ